MISTAQTGLVNTQDGINSKELRQVFWFAATNDVRLVLTT
ncbi:hypothetical protein MGMO_57c00210 [Methyloglobulus morosus KoM1]|uniref:Uncharacterized protein n=1 Tax=Methyloglobulus morosus KoM1 TaxID=1116472 RepID=V5DYP8_9GAMM|nr:hypothetical protein MGMO_57c00210 [Methyloglobulus morosus KoM1]